jgi:hypothetical protein
MVGVLVAATACGVAERRTRFRRLADYHFSQVADVDVCHDMHLTSDGQETYLCLHGKYVSIPWVDWHERLEQKYRRAASRPWLPVEADPSEPK